MRFKNITTKKENIEYFSGDVLILYNEMLCEDEVYMVITRYAKYNILNLNNGVACLPNYENYDDFVRELERLFILIEAVDNDELELVRVED